MRFLPDGWRRIAAIWRRAPDRDVDTELQFHLDERVAELVAGGMSPATARARAVTEFGDVASVRRGLVAIDGRMARRRNLLERWEWVGQDLGYVLRSLQHSPGFVIMVTLTLALGLGANVAIFSILDRLFLAAPPGIVHPETIRRVSRVSAPDPRDGGSRQPSIESVFAYGQLRDLTLALPDLSVAGYATDRGKLGRGDASQVVGIATLVGDYFGLLGVRPQLGRFFTSDELRPETPVFLAVLGDRIWRSQFGARPDVVGQAIELDGRRFVVVGVAAPAFHGADNDAVDVWVPMNTGESYGGGPWYAGTHTFWIQILLRPRGTPDDGRLAAAATNVFRHGSVMPDSTAHALIRSLVSPAASGFDTREVAIATRLSGVALIMLLISCANIANLLMARGIYRRGEIAVRVALGVSRRRLVGLLLAESICISMIGAAAALVVAFWAAGVLRHLLLPGVRWVDSPVNLHVLLFAVGIAIVTGILAGLMPAWQLSRPDVAATLKGSARAPALGHSRTRQALLLTQSALSVVLLAAAGVFVRSLHSVETEDIGYQADRVVFVSVSAQRGHTSQHADITGRLPALAEELRAVPGVERAALAANMPMWAISFVNWYVPGHDTTQSFGHAGPYATFAGPGFFEAMGMRLIRGRGIEPGDRLANATAIVVNQRLAKQLWPGLDPLAQCIIIDNRNRPCTPVVGVVADAHSGAIIEDPSMQFYLPLADSGSQWRAGVIVLRTAPGALPRVTATVQRQLRLRFAGWADVDVRPMTRNFERELTPWRAGAALFSAAGLLALLVAMVGVYSTISYTFSQRRHEMGVRIALGAGAGDVIRLVVADGVRVVLLGILIGLALAIAAGRVVKSLLYHTSPHDPGVLITVSLVLLLVAVASCLAPALRATRVDPAVALRAE
ncbi:MAG: ADOP family duplicated permease [Gemmatimonadales bacterium]